MKDSFFDNFELTPMGTTDWRTDKTPFGIRDKDRLGHIYVIGKTGVGKSTLLERMAISDIEKGKGIAIIDPHGDIAESILNYVPRHRITDVIYFNPKDTEHPIAFNPLKGIHPKYHHLVSSGLISTFKKIWADSWGPRMEYILRFSLMTLLSYPDATLLDIQALLTDTPFRNHVLTYITDQHIIAFWKQEFDRYPAALKAEAISPILNKTGLFLSSIPLRNTVGQKVRGFSMQEVIDTGKILVVNLSKGEIGEDASSLLGSILVNSIYLAAIYRARQEEHLRRPFYLYVDEMHSFVSLSFADILAEARKYKLSLFLAHQYVGQLHEKVRAAIFGNVGTIISFRVGAEDAEALAKEFYPVFTESDLVNLPKFSMYIKLMIDGATSKPFSANTQALSPANESCKEEIIDTSRSKFSRKENEAVVRKLLGDSDTPQLGLFTE
jgi:Type IV secretion-system coupling protein DNA-binding domain